jgi:flagellin
MGLRIQNNIAALNAHKNLSISDSAMSKSLERLSSGFRINRAADDAAGLSVSQQFRADIASYKVASRNVSEANSLLQVAEGAMDQVGNMLTRLKELATQASSANASANLEKINAEGNELLKEIDRIANSTEYSGAKLLNGGFGVSDAGTGGFDAGVGLASVSGLESGVTYTVAVDTGDNTMTISATLGSGQVRQTMYDVTAPASANETKTINFAALGLSVTINSDLTDDGGTIDAATATASNFQIGAKNSGDDRIGILLGSVKAADLDSDLIADQLLSASDAQTFMETIDNAISDLNTKRGNVGAAQNRLGYAAATLSTTLEIATAAESVIRDVDMASEMTTFTKNQILLQAGTAMLAQANSAPQQILSLFK